ncbi:hypothetical protein Scep_004851 [Stephania cephalantha]|uniref:Uncharacterized protein n=1 Tax=Stephania cephalantha TaxID=152367 RepID=A0AAP0KT76_9MAGN
MLSGSASSITAPSFNSLIMCFEISIAVFFFNHLSLRHLTSKLAPSSTVTCLGPAKNAQQPVDRPRTTQQPLLEDMQHINPKLQNSETRVTTILEHFMDMKELSPHPVFDLEKIVNVATLKSVKFDELSIVDEYLSEPEETLDVSSHELDITIAQNKDDEAEMKIEVISKRPEEPQKESKEDQPLVLVKPPTLPCILVKPYKGMEVKECSHIFYTVDTFVLDDHNATNSFVLEVSNELPNLMEVLLPKVVDAPFVVDISKGEASRDDLHQV